MRWIIAFLVAASWLFSFPAAASTASSRPWNEDVIYFAITDRFLDGDPENDVPAGSDPALYDEKQADIDRYHGGDFRGLELALKQGYFRDLGVTALWITPPVRNVWNSSFDAHNAPKTGYHGYWAQDFLDIDPHLVSRRSLDGSREYPDSRDGRMQHYKDFVALAHSQGIKVIQDIVCNHAGPVFFYDANGNGRFDLEEKAEWIQPFKSAGHYDNARWSEIPKWNMHRAAPAGPVTILGREVKVKGAVADLESYGRKGMSADSLGKSNGEEVECDFFGLRDFWTSPDGPHFNDLVDDFVAIYAFYAEEIGVDGFRIDTVKHVHHAFWDAFTERLRRRLGPERAKQFILFGEIYDGNPAKVGDYTYRGDWPQRTEPCLDAALNFPFCFAARSYLRVRGKPYGPASEVVEAMNSLSSTPRAGAQRPFYNPTRGLDGLNSEQKIVNFIENHDGLNRFRVQEISERRNLLANALLLFSPGIPCLYYGSEVGLQDAQAKIGPDAETGRLTFIPAGHADQLPKSEKTPAFKTIAALTALRRDFPALTSAETTPLRVDGDLSDMNQGVLAFARGEGADGTVVVVFNASNHENVTSVSGHSMKLVSREGKPLLTQGEKLVRVPIAGFESGADAPIEMHWDGAIPEVEIHIAPESVSVFRKAR